MDKENGMKKVGTLLAAMALAGAAQAGTYSIQQDTDCPLISAGELSKAVQQAGSTTGLNLPKDMALRTELRCAIDGKSARYVYTIRSTLEKQLADGEQQRWTPVVQLTRYGTIAKSDALLREVRFTARDLIRQEP
jgi:hypothetical protein